MSSARHCLDIPHLVPRILKRLLKFWKTCRPLVPFILILVLTKAGLHVDEDGKGCDKELNIFIKQFLISFISFYIALLLNYFYIALLLKALKHT